jgi:hypothetical protein
MLEDAVETTDFPARQPQPRIRDSKTGLITDSLARPSPKTQRRKGRTKIREGQRLRVRLPQPCGAKINPRSSWFGLHPRIEATSALRAPWVRSVWLGVPFAGFAPLRFNKPVVAMTEADAAIRRNKGPHASFRVVCLAIPSSSHRKNNILLENAPRQQNSRAFQRAHKYRDALQGSEACIFE